MPNPDEFAAEGDNDIDTFDDYEMSDYELEERLDRRETTNQEKLAEWYYDHPESAPDWETDDKEPPISWTPGPLSRAYTGGYDAASPRPGMNQRCDFHGSSHPDMFCPRWTDITAATIALKVYAAEKQAMLHEIKVNHIEIDALLSPTMSEYPPAIHLTLAFLMGAMVMAIGVIGWLLVMRG